MFKPSAQIIADSINLTGDRLTTFVLTYHRFIHSEFMTHRMLSKNSSSSRAIPVEKMIELIESESVEPLHWGANCKGMSAKEELNAQAQYAAQIEWWYARKNAITSARRMVEIGVHKQVVNRLLEPFSTITVICSGTEYQNFFNQRCHPDAQPEIQALANLMKLEYDASVPRFLEDGDWHIPLMKEEDWEELKLRWQEVRNGVLCSRKIAVGRCARVSYLNHDGVRNIEDDIKLHDRLLTSRPAHLSPFEHVAIALPDSEKCANFTGFKSYRKHLEEQKGI
jgi:thymidylate synthase ThyX